MKAQVRSRFAMIVRGGMAALVTVLILACSSSALAQWHYGGKLVFGNYGEQLLAFPDGNGNVIIANSFGPGPISKISPDGSTLWLTYLNQSGILVQGVPDGMGGALLGRYSGSSIELQRLSSSGAALWGNGVYGGETLNGWFRIVPDGTGGGFLFSAAPSGLYVIRFDLDGQLTNGPTALTSSGASMPEDAIPDGAGGAIVLWTDTANLFAQRVSSSNSLLWGATGITVCGAAGLQGGGRLVTDLLGGAFAAWTDYRGPEYKIYAQRIDSAGELMWELDGNRICPTDGLQSGIQITADGVGGIVAVWVDGRTGDNDIYAQRIGASGDAAWNPIGIPVCNAQGAQFSPQIVTVSSSFGVSWTDCRLTPAGDAYVQLLDLTGVALAEENGQLWSFKGGYKYNFKLTASAGSPVVAWFTEYHNDPVTGQTLHPRGIYAQSAVDAYYVSWGLGSARIQSTADVARDQGSRVSLRWAPSPYDNRSNEAITHYSVWRSFEGSSAAVQLDAAAIAGLLDNFESRGLRAEQTPTEVKYWEWLGDLEALSFEGYEFTASTLADSTSEGAAIHEFQVVTHSVDRFTYWKSEPMAGHSVDNLAPATPQGLASEYLIGQSLVKLHWQPNGEADLKNYNVYRGTGAGFVPSSDNLIAATSDTLALGPINVLEYPWHVKVSALDIHGNESGYALLAPTPPVAALFVDYGARRTEASIRVHWSTSQEDPAIDFKVYRVKGVDPASEIDVAISRSADQYWFEDAAITAADAYRYHITAVVAGVEIASFEVSVAPFSLSLSLDQNRPNPFNPATSISFVLPQEGAVELSVFDVAGRLVATLANETLPAGRHSLEWDGRTDNGEQASSGIYVYQLRTPVGVLSKKMTLLK